jgi:plastocyanin
MNIYHENQKQRRRIMKAIQKWLVVSGSLLFVGAILFQGNPTVSADSGGAIVKGMVTFSGTAPAPTKIKLTADPKCHEGHGDTVYSEEYVVGKKGELKNVFIYVKQGLEGKTFPPSTESAKISQIKCTYTPHVVGVQAGQPLEVSNGDTTMHNVNAQPKNNPGFNFAQPIQGMKTTKKFAKKEVMIPFICNVHPWMKSYIGVVEHPFFSVSGDNGQFEIKDLPAGTYVLEAWHEKLGTATQNITVGAGETKTVNFLFKKA